MAEQSESECLDDTWAELERVGRLTGHVVTRCPSCRGQAMTSILNASGTSRWAKTGGGWPRCRQCPAGRGKAGVRVEPVGDVALVARVRPGHPPRPGPEDPPEDNLGLALLDHLAGGDRTRRDLARLTGARPAVVGRALAWFTARGWVTVAARRRHQLTPEGQDALREASRRAGRVRA